MNKIYSNIPKMDLLLENENVLNLIQTYGKATVKKFLQLSIEKIKKKLLSDKNLSKPAISSEIIKNASEELSLYFSPQLKKIINATGVVLHTNFGRAPLSEAILDNVKKVACNYSNLEFNLKTGKRGIRYQNIIKYLIDLTGAEDALVVNNNAAAVLLTLSAIAKEKEVIVSRGELVEIGGSFRIPEVMEQSGAILKEIGATNKTHLKDYINAINENTGAILKAHTSNYRIVGFTESVVIEELVKLGKDKKIPVIFDIGSGSFIDFSQIGLPHEPTVESVIKQGVDIVTFSGDKLLGGPQAGIILGKKKYIEILKRHPLNRALRIGKFTLAALEPLFKFYFNKETAINNILSIKLITCNLEVLKTKAEKINNFAQKCENFYFTIKEDFAFVGGGAFPTDKLKTVIMILHHKKFSAAKIEHILRNASVPVIGRIKDDSFIIDVRTVLDTQINELVDILKKYLDN